MPHGAVYVSGVARKYELIVISLGGERLRHVLVGQNPIVHSVAHHIGIEKIAIAHLHPDPYRFPGILPNEVLVELPGTVWHLRIVRPLLVHKSSGIREDTMIELRVIPSHDQGAGASRAVTDRRPGVRIFRESHVRLPFHHRQNFLFHELAIESGHGVVLQASFATLGVSAAVSNRNANHDGDLMLGDQRIQSRKQHAVGPICTDNKRRGGARNVLLGNVDGHLTRIGRRMTGGDEQLRGIRRISSSERVGLACDARINLTVGRIHRELDHASVWRTISGRHCRSGIMRWADDEVAINIRGRDLAIGQLPRLDVARSMRIACGWQRAFAVLGGRRRLVEGGNDHERRQES